MWATEATARSLATKADPLSYISNLKLSDASPRAVAAFVNADSTNSASSPFLTSSTVRPRSSPIPRPTSSALRGRRRSGSSRLY